MSCNLEVCCACPLYPAADNLVSGPWEKGTGKLSGYWICKVTSAKVFPWRKGGPRSVDPFSDLQHGVVWSFVGLLTVGRPCVFSRISLMFRRWRYSGGFHLKARGLHGDITEWVPDPSPQKPVLIFLFDRELFLSRKSGDHNCTVMLFSPLHFERGDHPQEFYEADGETHLTAWHRITLLPRLISI